MTFVDTIILLIVLGGLAIGYYKGLTRQLASLVSWAAAIVICYVLGDWARDTLLALNPEAANWPMPSVTVKAVAVSFLFLLVILVIRVVSRLLRLFMKTIHLGFLDKWGGAALFVFKYLFILSIVLNLLLAFAPGSSTFHTRHMLGNVPYEFTLDLMPRVLGNDTLPSDMLPPLQSDDHEQATDKQ